MKVLAGTKDDAAGEAFDKGGKMLGLAYPAGKIIDDLAKEGDKNKYEFPIGLRHSKDGFMSFSGVKTALRQFIENENNDINDQQVLKDVCASYQEAIVQAIKVKTQEVLTKYQLPKETPLVLGGGVACNSRLRAVLKALRHLNVAPSFCTDNGAMIANYAQRTPGKNISYPDCLSLDARSRFV